MSFLAILFALLIEQVRPLAPGNPIHSTLRGWSMAVSRNIDTGDVPHGWVAWALAVGVPTVVAAGVHIALALTLGYVAALLWSVAVLYACLGFRQFSHHFTDIRDALDEGNEDAARDLLARWQQVDASQLPRREIVRHVIEYSVLAAHRHVFGVIAWYVLLAVLGLGPAGAVLFRMSEFVGRYWKYKSLAEYLPVSAALHEAASRAWLVIDWLPARITAMGFAVVGSFEDAIDGWRHHAQQFPNDNDGVILAATSGALNVRLGGEALRTELATGTVPGAADTESTPGRAPEPGHLRSVVGLVWRTVVMWMVLLALLTLARLIG